MKPYVVGCVLRACRAGCFILRLKFGKWCPNGGAMRIQLDSGWGGRGTDWSLLIGY
jgi:hypothetical protein